MSTSDVCVNPDRANEMNDTYIMNKMLEYMALGKPIVEFDLTEGRFSAGQASLYARPDEVADFAVKLCELRDNSEQHATMGATGTRRGRNQPGLASPGSAAGGGLCGRNEEQPRAQSPAVNRSCVKVGHRGPRILLLGPARSAVSGVSTHLNQLFESALSRRFCLLQFQVGSEGRAQGRMATLFRLLTDPFALTVCLIRCRPRIVHINTSLEPRSYWRDIVFLALAKTMKRAVVYQVHGGALPAEFFASNRVLTALLRRVLSWPDSVVLLARSEMAAYSSFAPRARLRSHPKRRVARRDRFTCRALQRASSSQSRLPRATRGRQGHLRDDRGGQVLRDRGVAVHLTIAGSGAARGEITQVIEANRLGDQACLVEAVFGSAKQQLWREADVLASQPIIARASPTRFWKPWLAASCP